MNYGKELKTIHQCHINCFSIISQITTYPIYFLACNRAMNEWKTNVIRDSQGFEYAKESDSILLVPWLAKVLRSLSHFAYHDFTMQNRAERLQRVQCSEGLRADIMWSLKIKTH